MFNLYLVTFLFSTFFFQFTIASEKSAEDLFAANAECCGESINLVLDLNYAKKTAQLKQMKRFKEQLCKMRNPKDFGNALLLLKDNKTLVYKAKIQVPRLQFQDFETDNKPDGTLREIEQTVFVLKVPSCFEYRNKKIEITDLQNNLLLKGEL